MRLKIVFDVKRLVYTAYEIQILGDGYEYKRHLWFDRELTNLLDYLIQTYNPTQDIPVMDLEF